MTAVDHCIVENSSEQIEDAENNILSPNLSLKWANSIIFNRNSNNNYEIFKY